MTGLKLSSGSLSDVMSRLDALGSKRLDVKVGCTGKQISIMYQYQYEVGSPESLLTQLQDDQIKFASKQLQSVPHDFPLQFTTECWRLSFLNCNKIEGLVCSLVELAIPYAFYQTRLNHGILNRRCMQFSPDFISEQLLLAALQWPLCLVCGQSGCKV